MFLSADTNIQDLWQKTLIPAFEKAHPEIKVTYQATDTNDYNAAIQLKVESGTGPDVIMCRPFDVNRAVSGHLETDLNTVPMGPEGFEPPTLSFEGSCSIH